MKLVLVLTAVALSAAACTNGSSRVGSGGGATELTGAGATFPAPLYQKWASEYAAKYAVKVNYQAIGSGGGIQQITAKTVDFGASDAPMKDAELAKAPGILHIPTVFGAVAVTYNLSGAPLMLTPDAVAGIFLGKVKRWNDPAIAASNAGVGLPPSAIHVVHRSDGSGTTSIFTSYLKAVSAEWSSAVGAGKEVAWPVGLGGKGNDGVTALVKQTPGAVGYVELEYARENNLPVASIRNRAGAFVEPTLASITAAAASAQVPGDLRFSIVDAPGQASYPIAGATWLLVYREQADKAKGQALVKFLWWAIHDGESDAEPLLYAPLPPTLVAKAEAMIKSIAFGGAALYQG